MKKHKSGHAKMALTVKMLCRSSEIGIEIGMLGKSIVCFDGEKINYLYDFTAF